MFYLVLPLEGELEGVCLRRGLLSFLLCLLLLSCSDGQVNNKYCNLSARLTIENVTQAPVLFTACESMGEYCTVRTVTPQSFATSPVVRVVCFDLACSNCYQSYKITKPLTLQTGGYAKCPSCQRLYNLNDCGTIADGPAGRSLYRYRVSFVGTALIINNG